MLCDALVGTGYFTKDEQGEYGVPPFAEAFLDPEKPSYLGSMVNIFRDPVIWDNLTRLAETVRNGANGSTPCAHARA